MKMLTFNQWRLNFLIKNVEKQIFSNYTYIHNRLKYVFDITLYQFIEHIIKRRKFLLYHRIDEWTNVLIYCWHTSASE